MRVKMSHHAISDGTLSWHLDWVPLDLSLLPDVGWISRAAVSRSRHLDKEKGH